MINNMNENAMIVMNQIMMELQQWLNRTYELEFEIRESDYVRWLDYSRKLAVFNKNEVKLFKEKFDQLIYSMRPQKVLFFGTLYMCPTMTVRRVYEELANINMNFMTNI